MSIDQWSTTPATNSTAATGINWAEGQAPSTVNDSARAMMADVAGWYGQAKQNLALTGVAGTNTITATAAAAVASLAANQLFTLIPAATNTGATTLNITPSGGAALTAKNVFFNGAACAGGELVINVPTKVMYDGTQFNIMGPALPATKAQQQAAISNSIFVTPLHQQDHPSSAKAWIVFASNGATGASYNVTSVTHNGAGDNTINFTTAFASTAYCAVGTSGLGNGTDFFTETNFNAAPTVSACRMGTFSGGRTPTDVVYCSFMALGTQ